MAAAVLDRVRAGIRGTVEAIVRGPRAALAWLRREPARAVAYAWLAGLVTFGWITYRRWAKQHQREAAIAAALPAVKPKRPPEVIQLADVDDLNQARIDRLHELGLAAAGEDRPPDAKTIAAAHAARTKAVAAEGEQVYGDDDVVVVSKGGIAGWIARNRDKKPDPETLAWLRGEEKRDGIAAYAAWADDGKGDGIAGWLARGRRGSGASPGREAGVTGPDPNIGSGSGGSGGSGGAGNAGGAVGSGGAGGAGGSGGGSGAGEAAGPVIPAAPDPEPTAVPAGRELDVELMGEAALAILDPAIRLHREPTDGDVDALRMQLAPAGQVAVSLRAHHLVIALPGDPEATKPRLRALAAALAALADQDFLLASADPERTLAAAVQLAVGGLAPDRLVIGSAAPADPSALEIVVLQR